MAAAQYPIAVEAGSTYSIVLTFKDSSNVALDLTGQTFAGQVRAKVTDADPLGAFVFVVKPQTGATLGQVLMTLPASVSSSFPVAPQKTAQRVSKTFAYDCERTFVDGTVERFLEGIMTVDPEVTRG